MGSASQAWLHSGYDVAKSSKTLMETLVSKIVTNATFEWNKNFYNIFTEGAAAQKGTFVLDTKEVPEAKSAFSRWKESDDRTDDELRYRFPEWVTKVLFPNATTEQHPDWPRAVFKETDTAASGTTLYFDPNTDDNRFSFLSFLNPLAGHAEQAHSLALAYRDYPYWTYLIPVVPFLFYMLFSWFVRERTSASKRTSVVASTFVFSLAVFNMLNFLISSHTMNMQQEADVFQTSVPLVTWWGDASVKDIFFDIYVFYPMVKVSLGVIASVIFTGISESISGISAGIFGWISGAVSGRFGKTTSASPASESLTWNPKRRGSSPAPTRRTDSRAELMSMARAHLDRARGNIKAAAFSLAIDPKFS